MKEKNRGITLIALIITIIVMLILVAVTINMAVNGGLFGYAGNAAKDTETEKNKELQLADGIVGGQTIESIVSGFSSLEPNKTIPAGGVYIRMSPIPTAYYSELIGNEEEIINELFVSYGYSQINFSSLEYEGEVPPSNPQQGDVYLYEDYMYGYSYTMNSTFLDGWAATTYDKTKTSYKNVLQSINGEELSHMRGTYLNCANLTISPAIPDCVTDYDWLFQGCNSLTSAPTFPNGRVSLVGTFYGCTSLTNAQNAMVNAISIGNSTFRRCPNLKSLIIPKTVTSIGSYIFEDCINLASITYQGTKSEWHIIDLDPQWNAYSSIITIHCTDGDITFDESRY